MKKSSEIVRFTPILGLSSIVFEINFVMVTLSDLYDRGFSMDTFALTSFFFFWKMAISARFFLCGNFFWSLTVCFF